ncbi:MAG: N-acetyltransferase family protein [Actinomycetota bacterium]
MNIRMARLDDIEPLFDIRTSVTENYLSREEIAQFGINPESVAKMLESDCRAWVAEIGNRAIGFSMANATEKTVFALFVLPAFEGRGVGRALIQVAENWLRSQGIEEIWLVTGNDSKLRAYGFYLHLNWMPAGVVSEGDFTGYMKFIKRLV